MRDVTVDEFSAFLMATRGGVSLPLAVVRLAPAYLVDVAGLETVQDLEGLGGEEFADACEEALEKDGRVMAAFVRKVCAGWIMRPIAPKTLVDDALEGLADKNGKEKEGIHRVFESDPKAQRVTRNHTAAKKARVLYREWKTAHPDPPKEDGECSDSDGGEAKEEEKVAFRARAGGASVDAAGLAQLQAEFADVKFDDEQEEEEEGAN